MPYVKFRCIKCHGVGERHHNASKCIREVEGGGYCGGQLVRVADDPEICPTCGRRFDGTKPKRICALCGKVIGRSDKWQIIDGSRIAHRNCDDPTRYTKPKE